MRGNSIATRLFVIAVCCIAAGALLGTWAASVAGCTPTQRRIAETAADVVLTIAEELCDDRDSAGECIRKCEAEQRRREADGGV